MSVLDSTDVPVPLGYCPCEGTPHPDGDIVYLRQDLTVGAGIRARSWFADAMTNALDPVDLQERIAELWLSVGCVVSWTFLDDDGDPIPVTPENIVRALPYAKGGRLVADKADDLYVASVVTPLAEKLATLLKRGRTKSSRRATPPKTPSQRKRRSPSSIATTDKVPPLE